MRPPDILFLMSDEHRADVAGFAGNPVIRTPVLDELAHTGTVFTNAYTPSPICIPARQCIAAGQWTQTCGVKRFGQDLPPFSMTFARWLGEHGYETVACGKLHHTGEDQMQGWQHRIGMDSHNRRALRGMKWTDAKEVRRAGIGRPLQTAVSDDYATEGCLHYIDQAFLDPWYDRATPDQPRLLYLGLTNPHYPYLAPEDLFNYYLNRVEPFVDEPVFDHPWLGRTATTPGPVRVGPDGDVTERDVRRATAAYYANVDRNERLYRRVLDRLVEAGEDLDDWVIVYTSDHGEMLGEHSIWEKQKFFEGSVRVPLVIRWPAMFKPGVVDANVSLCDLFATLCDFAGCERPPADRCVNGRPLDSRSLRPLMEGRGKAWPDLVVSTFAGADLMIKEGALKYQRYNRPACAAEPEVLFDLAADPTERRNLIHEERYGAALQRLRTMAAAYDAGDGLTQLCDAASSLTTS